MIREYLYWGLGLTGLCAWAVKDGWWATGDMLEHVAFNKSLAVLALIGAMVCFYIHKVVK